MLIPLSPEKKAKRRKKSGGERPAEGKGSARRAVIYCRKGWGEKRQKNGDDKLPNLKKAAWIKNKGVRRQLLNVERKAQNNE